MGSRVVETKDEDEGSEAEALAKAEAEADELSREMQLKRASLDYQMLWFLESGYFIFVVCILVVLDVNLSTANDMSSNAIRFMAVLTGFFIGEFFARFYYHSVVGDVKLFFRRPLTLLDLLCVITDVIVFGAFFAVCSLERGRQERQEQ